MKMVEGLRPELRAFRGENGNELLDLPEARSRPRTHPRRYAPCRTTTSRLPLTPADTALLEIRFAVEVQRATGLLHVLASIRTTKGA